MHHLRLNLIPLIYFTISLMTNGKGYSYHDYTKSATETGTILHGSVYYTVKPPTNLGPLNLNLDLGNDKEKSPGMEMYNFITAVEEKVHEVLKKLFYYIITSLQDSYNKFWTNLIENLKTFDLKHMVDILFENLPDLFREIPIELIPSKNLLHKTNNRTEKTTKKITSTPTTITKSYASIEDTEELMMMTKNLNEILVYENESTTISKQMHNEQFQRPHKTLNSVTDFSYFKESHTEAVPSNLKNVLLKQKNLSIIPSATITKSTEDIKELMKLLRKWNESNLYKHETAVVNQILNKKESEFSRETLLKTVNIFYNKLQNSIGKNDSSMYGKNTASTMSTHVVDANELLSRKRNKDIRIVLDNNTERNPNKTKSEQQYYSYDSEEIIYYDYDYDYDDYKESSDNNENNYAPSNMAYKNVMIGANSKSVKMSSEADHKSYLKRKYRNNHISIETESSSLTSDYNDDRDYSSMYTELDNTNT